MRYWSIQLFNGVSHLMLNPLEAEIWSVIYFRSQNVHKVAWCPGNAQLLDKVIIAASLIKEQYCENFPMDFQKNLNILSY